MYKYSGKIKCMDCGSNFRGKMQRYASVYLCSGYHNKKSDCRRFIIKEGELDEMIDKHKWVVKERFDRIEELPNEEYVKQIQVHNKEEGYTIRYQDGTESIMSKTHIKY